MRVLIGCEESGVARRAFRERGHTAFSCDLKPARDGEEAYHFQEDIMECLERTGPWDIIILHPVCDALTVAGNATYAEGNPKYNDRLKSIKWTQRLWGTAVRKAKKGVCLENPIGVLPRLWGSKRQVIQPWQYGHKETKATVLHLFNLPNLQPTNIVGPPPKEPEERKKWEVCWRMAPGPNRKRDRSETKTGVADAFAEQWGER